MGTRSTVKFYNEYDKERKSPILSVYQQYDGYYPGVGQELAEWLSGKTIINGISGQTMEQGFANGMGCLAAQYVAKFKEKIGGFYLTTADDQQGYDYVVYKDENGLKIAIDDFDGTPNEFIEFVEKEESEEEN